MTEIESLQALLAELTDTINNRPSTLYGPSPASFICKCCGVPA